MKKVLFVVGIAFCNSVFAQSFTQAYKDRTDQITQANINSTLADFASFGVKTTGSANNASALNWLKTKYASFGYTDIAEDPFTFGSTSSKNLVVTKKGTLYPDTYLIVCGHFDTIAGPGVNDNGSGVSIILEIARILKSVPTDYSIKFINFSGEEQGLFGSQHYVNTIVNGTTPKMNIRLVFNIDEVGGIAGQLNDTVFCDEDRSTPTSNNAASQQFTKILANCTTLYTGLKTEFDPAYASDYIPFQNNGEIITGFYEHNVSPYPHTANDTYLNMDPVYVFNVGKAALGAVQHFAVASGSVLSVVDCPPEQKLESLKIYPNPAKDILQIAMINQDITKYIFTINDSSGKLVLRSENEKIINISKLTNGIYFGTLSIDGKKVSKKIIVQK